MKTLCDLLRSFIDGPDRSITAAQKIESMILDLDLEEDPELEAIIDMIASYRPGGGDYLYDERQLLTECRRLLKVRKWD